MKTLLTIISLLMLSTTVFGAGPNCGNRTTELETQIANITSSMSGIGKTLCEQEMRAAVNGRSNQATVEAVCQQTQDVAWFPNRSNRMTEIDLSQNTVDGRVGRAMAVVMSKNTTTQAIQVCPGVYLATAHGVLDSPEAAAERTDPEDKAVREPKDQRTMLFPYPMSPDNIMRASTNTQYVSPRLRDPSKWDDDTTDYVFIKVNEGEASRPNDFVRPLDGGVDDFVKASEVDQVIDIELYRGKTRFNMTEEGDAGIPDYDRSTWVQGARNLTKVYDAPLKVEESCRVIDSQTGMLGTDCPSEFSVSGSPLISKIDGEPYLVGTANKAVHRKVDELNPANSNDFVISASFCTDYEDACGIPCASFENTVPKEEQNAAIEFEI